MATWPTCTPLGATAACSAWAQLRSQAIAAPTGPHRGTGRTDEAPVVNRIVPEPRASMSGNTWFTAVAAPWTLRSIQTRTLSWVRSVADGLRSARAVREDLRT